MAHSPCKAPRVGERRVESLRTCSAADGARSLSAYPAHQPVVGRARGPWIASHTTPLPASDLSGEPVALRAGAVEPGFQHTTSGPPNRWTLSNSQAGDLGWACELRPRTTRESAPRPEHASRAGPLAPGPDASQRTTAPQRSSLAPASQPTNNPIHRRTGPVLVIRTASAKAPGGGASPPTHLRTHR